MSQLAVLDPFAAKIKIFAAPLKTIMVSDEVSQLNAESQLREAAALLKGVAAARKAYTDPLEQQKKFAIAREKEICSLLDEGVTHLKGQLSGWAKKLEEKRQAELKAAAEERARKEEELRLEAARNVTPEPEAKEPEWHDLFSNSAPIVDPTAELKRVEAQAAVDRKSSEIAHDHRQQTKQIESQKVSGARKVWKHEVTDAAAVPREFLVVDETAIRRAIAAGTRAIAGVKIFEETIISAGRR
jgi:hypothetical protein